MSEERALQAWTLRRLREALPGALVEKRQPGRFGGRGAADFAVVHGGGYGELELKSPRGRLTRAQQHRRYLVALGADAVFEVARTKADVERFVARMKARSRVDHRAKHVKTAQTEHCPRCGRVLVGDGRIEANLSPTNPETGSALRGGCTGCAAEG